jgi:hypothetical protein
VKVHIAATRRENHRAAHQRLTNGGQGRGLAPKQIGHRPDRLWPVTQVRHRRHVEALGFGELADSILVELLVEVGFDHGLGRFDIIEGDDPGVVLTPYPPAVLLEEEWIALGEFEYAPDGVLLPRDLLAFSGQYESGASGGRWEGAEIVAASEFTS